jgi:hypothetical protein
MATLQSRSLIALAVLKRLGPAQSVPFLQKCGNELRHFMSCNRGMTDCVEDWISMHHRVTSATPSPESMAHPVIDRLVPLQETARASIACILMQR